MRYILNVDFYTKANKTVPILLYAKDFGSTIEFRTNLSTNSMVMSRMSSDFESGALLIKTPSGGRLETAIWGAKDTFYAKFTDEMTTEVGEYEYQLRINVMGGMVTSSPYKYNVLPQLFEIGDGSSIVDEAIVDEVYVGDDSYTYITKSGYEKTIWIPHETLISAQKMNKIENQLEILTDSASGGGGGTGIQISATEPLDKSVLWVDIADEI